MMFQKVRLSTQKNSRAIFNYFTSMFTNLTVTITSMFTTMVITVTSIFIAATRIFTTATRIFIALLGIFVTVASLFITLASLPAFAAVESEPSVSAASEKTGVLTNNIIPPDGELFHPDAGATRGTVAMALFNVADDRTLRGADTLLRLTDEFAAGFTDVLIDSPYYTAVSYCASMGYINGYPDGTYDPEGFITRSELCAILCRYLKIEVRESTGADAVPPTDDDQQSAWGVAGVTVSPTVQSDGRTEANGRANPTLDVPPGSWAYDFVTAVVNRSLMSGYPDGKFRPDSALTRSELAVAIVKAQNLRAPSYIRQFMDVPQTHWAYNYVACVSAPPVSEPSPYEAEIAARVNETRGDANVSELVLDPLLCEIARIKAQDMIDNDYFDHESPIWGMPEEMTRTLGAPFEFFGENAAFGAATPADVVRLWSDSPSHYENMVSPTFNRTGVGVAIRSDGRIMWVQIFT